MARLDAAVIPLDVAARWAAWLDEGRPDLVRADLRRLMVDVGAPAPGADPPSSSAGPQISTR